MIRAGPPRLPTACMNAWPAGPAARTAGPTMRRAKTAPPTQTTADRTCRTRTSSGPSNAMTTADRAEGFEVWATEVLFGSFGRRMPFGRGPRSGQRPQDDRRHEHEHDERRDRGGATQAQ